VVLQIVRRRQQEGKENFGERIVSHCQELEVNDHVKSMKNCVFEISQICFDILQSRTSDHKDTSEGELASYLSRVVVRPSSQPLTSAEKRVSCDEKPVPTYFSRDFLAHRNELCLVDPFAVVPLHPPYIACIKVMICRKNGNLAFESLKSLAW
jgi:hypothetical protein